MAEAGSSRPRRSTRVPNKGPETVVPAQTPKKKARDPEAQLEYLLTNPKSKLTTTDITAALNYENFLDLSTESQEILCSLLPPTAFATYQPPVDATHPANHEPCRDEDGMDLDVERSPATLDPLFFTSPFMLSAAHTFQDHIFSSWMTHKASESVAKFQEGVQDPASNIRAEWKDEEWRRDHVPRRRPAQLQADELDLIGLAKQSDICEGDLLVYARRFPNLGLTVEKDLLVQSINPLSFAMTLLIQPSTTTSLPGDLLVVGPPPPKPPILSVDDILSSADLEATVLDVDGRVPRGDRIVANLVASASLWSEAKDVPPHVIAASRAAKALTVWRWKPDVLADVEMQAALERGARSPVGTVFYLRRR